MPKFPVRVYEIPANLRERDAVPVGLEKIEADDFASVPAAARVVFEARGRTVHREMLGDSERPDININAIVLVAQE